MALKDKRRVDLGSVLGLALGLAAVLGGHLLEGGLLSHALKGPAAVIVLGGTLGAIIAGTPLALLRETLRRIPSIFFDSPVDYPALIDQVVAFSTRARKHGIVSLEAEASELPDAFLKKALMLAVDGVDTTEIRSAMELQYRVEEDRGEHAAKVFEAAGGYAPTIGIIGAVLGLILVMHNIKDMDAVGEGIASAFVATIYGVGSANLLFLPAAQKIRMRAQSLSERRELQLEGVIGIAEGLNPKLIRGKLEAYLHPASTRTKQSPAPAAKQASEAA